MFALDGVGPTTTVRRPIAAKTGSQRVNAAAAPAATTNSCAAAAAGGRPKTGADT